MILWQYNIYKLVTMTMVETKKWVTVTTVVPIKKTLKVS